MTAAEELRARFAIRDHVSFHDGISGSTVPAPFIEIRVVTAQSEATLYTYGAHLTRWIPRGGKPVMYLSPKAIFAPGKAIRGGIPVLFPWFGPRWDGGPAGVTSPQHGFARISEWAVTRTHLSPDGAVEVELSLGPTELSRSLGYDGFRTTMLFRIGAELSVTLSVRNEGTQPLVFEEGLHAYLAVGEIEQVRINGLRGSTFIDKRDADIRKVQRESLLAITRDVDQVHVHTGEPLRVIDPGLERTIQIDKEGSNGTVVWNPWSTLSPEMKDLPDDGWRHFVCVETVNTGDDRITLQPGAEHRMTCRFLVEPEGV